jgi:hypothetical protein
MRLDGRQVLAGSISARLTRAVDEGLAAAAVVDREGNVVALAGAIADDEAKPLTALVMHRLAGADLATRLLGGEIVELALDERDVAVGIAKRQLYVVAVLGASTEARELVRELHDDVEGMLDDLTGPAWSPIPGNGGGSGSGPAALLGIPVGRERAKA